MDWKMDSNLHEILSQYVLEGYTQSEILFAVSKEFSHYKWSARTLTRRLQYFHITKNDSALTVNDVKDCIEVELKGTGKLLGYRSMHKKLRMVYGLKVKVHQVYHVMKVLDPDGIEERKLTNKKFKRRVFTSRGPNWVWSLDGHDKLMGWHKCEYALAIHGCIDTFSRKITWLKAWPSNSSPKLVTRFYYEAVKKLNVLPAFLRSDRGNENTELFAVHNFLRGTNDGSSYRYGSSTTNQVIQRWWRELRERNGNFIRSSLETLTSTGLYDSSNETCRVILATMLVPVLQHELNIFKDCWNSHRIRKQDIRRPCGIPNFLYDYPENFRYASAGYQVDRKKLLYIEEKLELENDVQFIPPEVHNAILGILKKANLHPVTLNNFVNGYTVVYTGCKTKSIDLEFLK